MAPLPRQASVVDDSSTGSAAANETAAVNSEGAANDAAYGAQTLDYRGGLLYGNAQRAQTRVAFGSNEPRGASRGAYSQTVQQVLDSIVSSRDPQVLTRMQRDLYDSGFFDDSYYSKPAKGHAQPAPSWGKLDDGTLTALQNALDTTILRGGTFQETLNTQKQIHDAQVAADKKAEDEGKRVSNPPRVFFAENANVTTPDPDAIALTVDAVAQQMLGQNLDPEAKAAIVGQVMQTATALAQAQGSAQAANSVGIGQAQGLEYQMSTQAEEAAAAGTPAPQFSAPGGAQTVGGTASGGGQTYITGGGVNTFQDVSPEAQANRLIEDRFADEAKKYARTKQVNVLLDMIKNGVG